MRDKISFLLPSYNRLEMLKNCIERLQDSVRGLDLDFELCLVLDDPGNKANWADLTRNFLGHDNGWRYRLDHSRMKRGALWGWNRALEMSEGNYLFPIGDDGWCHDNWLQIALDVHKNKLDGYGCVGLNDLMHDGSQTVCTTLFYDRQFCKDHFNG